uniref:Uncharacterized protein n=1 Tax=Rhipicephalus zambeziensis TaxID=60191 RepID=A0A224YB08_9ACAR
MLCTHQLTQQQVLIEHHSAYKNQMTADALQVAGMMSVMDNVVCAHRQANTYWIPAITAEPCCTVLLGMTCNTGACGFTSSKIVQGFNLPSFSELSDCVFLFGTTAKLEKSVYLQKGQWNQWGILEFVKLYAPVLLVILSATVHGPAPVQHCSDPLVLKYIQTVFLY